MEYIKLNNTWNHISNIYKKINDLWILRNPSFMNLEFNNILFYDTTDISLQVITLFAPSRVTAETIECALNSNGSTLTSGISWSIISGSSYGTINQNGLITISSSANNSKITVQAIYNGVSYIKDIIATYLSGASSETEIIDNGDGTSTEVTNIDNGDGTSTEITITDNGDGTTTQNTSNTDTSGNVQTQTVETDENGNSVVTGYTIDTSANENGGIDLNGNSGVDTGVNAFDGSDFEIYLKAKIKASENTSASSAPIINLRKDQNSNLYGFTVTCTYSSSAQIMSNSYSSGLRMSAVLYTGSSSISKWLRQTEKIGNYYYYFGIRTSDGDTTYIYRITKSGNIITCRIYDETDNELIGVVRNSSTSDEYTFESSAEYSGVTIEIGHSTSRQGTDQYCNLEIIELQVNKITN